MYLANPWKLLPTTSVAKVEVLDPQHLYLSNLLHALPKLGKCQYFVQTFQNIKLMTCRNQLVTCFSVELTKMMYLFRNECVNNWYNKSSLKMIQKNELVHCLDKLFLGNSGNIRFNVKFIFHTHRLFENYIRHSFNIFSQK